MTVLPLSLILTVLSPSLYRSNNSVHHFLQSASKERWGTLLFDAFIELTFHIRPKYFSVRELQKEQPQTIRCMEARFL